MPRSRLTVKVWCLPRQTEEQLKSFHQALVEAVVKLEIGVHGEDDMTVLFPPDAMAYGLGSEILVEVSSLPAYVDTPPRYMQRPLNALATDLGVALKSVLQQYFPQAHVQGSFLLGHDF